MIEELHQLGLTKGEAKVYVALLQLGSSTVGPIVKKASVAYSNIYEILNRLSEKGLVSHQTKEKTKYYQATNPKNLGEFLKEQEEQIQLKQQDFKTIQPQLQKLLEQHHRQEAEIYTGTKGLRTAYENLLEGSKKTGGLFFYVHNEQYYEESELFYRKLWKKIDRHGVTWKGLSSKEFKSTKLTQKYPSFITQRYVDFPLPGIIDIVGNKTLITTWQEQPVGILIHSKEIAKNFRDYFDTIWKTATE